MTQVQLSDALVTAILQAFTTREIYILDNVRECENLRDNDINYWNEELAQVRTNRMLFVEAFATGCVDTKGVR